MDTTMPKGARDERAAAGLNRRQLDKDQLTDLQEKALSHDKETERRSEHER